MSKIARILRGYKAVQYYKNYLLLSRGYEIYRSDYSLEKTEYITTVPASRFNRIAIKSRLLARLLRLDLGPSCIIDDSNKILICASKNIYLLDAETGVSSVDFRIPRGSKPLKLSEINVDGFAPGVYFGEYIYNPHKGEVRIYHRNIAGEWNVVYTFGSGEINHVHAIFPDPDGRCVYILTGDFGDGAGIWRAEDGFRKVERFICEGQASRACWLVPYDKRLYYATDTQLEVNYLCSALAESKDKKKIIRHFPILGSSIYSICNHSGKILFSTAVEPDEVKGSKFLALFSNRRGPGIISDSAGVYFGSVNGSIELVLVAKKDWLPFRLFQFGSFHFPSGSLPLDGSIHAFGVALKGYDNSTILIEVTE